jgi:hypothetical protein
MHLDQKAWTSASLFRANGVHFVVVAYDKCTYDLAAHFHDADAIVAALASNRPKSDRPIRAGGVDFAIVASELRLEEKGVMAAEHLRARAASGVPDAYRFV